MLSCNGVSARRVDSPTEVNWIAANPAAKARLDTSSSRPTLRHRARCIRERFVRPALEDPRNNEDFMRLSYIILPIALVCTAACGGDDDDNDNGNTTTGGGAAGGAGGATGGTGGTGTGGTGTGGTGTGGTGTGGTGTGGTTTGGTTTGGTTTGGTTTGGTTTGATLGTGLR